MIIPRLTVGKMSGIMYRYEIVEVKMFKFSAENIEAFTLAEVLITLGVIGIVAAMTIPTLITNYQKKVTVNRLKKTYALITNAVRLSEYENGEVAGWVIPQDKEIEIFDKYLAPHLKVSKRNSTSNSLLLYSPGGARETGLAIVRGGAAIYTLLSGVDIIVNSGAVVGTAPCPTCGTSIGLLVDLNGYNAKPNRFGRDLFFITVTTNKGVLLHYSDDGEVGTVQRTKEQLKNGPSLYNYQCNKRGRGLWCGALIKADSWNISKDYPW